MQRLSVSIGRLCDRVIPAWSAGIQIDMDVSGHILWAWMPAIHAGMTEKEPGIEPVLRVPWGEVRS
jgi:hypothetical protein